MLKLFDISFTKNLVTRTYSKIILNSGKLILIRRNNNIFKKVKIRRDYEVKNDCELNETRVQIPVSFSDDDSYLNADGKKE